jgi:lipopolysaccharide heptosyltransferase II
LPAIDPASVRKILVIRGNLLGDVLNSMTAVQALRERYPAARITMLTLPYTAEIPRHFDCVDEVVSLDTNSIRSPRNMCSPATYRTFLAVIGRLRGEHFDLCLSLYGRMASFLALASGARRRVGYEKEAYPFVLTDPVPGRRFDRRRHEIDWDLGLAEAAGAGSRRLLPELRPRAQAVTRMEARLAALGAGPADVVVGIHGGAVNGSAKRWPAGHWAALADALIEQHGFKVVLTGSAGERSIAAEITARMRRQPIVLTGETTVEELLAVLARCDLVVSGDSGPLHLAVALGRPTVSIYGPTDPAIYGPAPRPGQAAIVIRRGLGCSPCYTLRATAECPYGRPSCMLDVPVSRVLRAVTEVLEKAP